MMGRRRFAPQERENLVAQVLALSGDGVTQHRIAARLGLSQPTVHIWLRRYGPTKLTLQQRVAEKIRVEMVCCDIYQRYLQAGDDAAAKQLLLDTSDVTLHHVCFYGEWAAQIAEQVKR